MPSSRIAYLIVSPDTLILLALAIGLLGWWLRLRFAKGLTIIAAVLLLFIAYIPVGTYLLRPLESRFAPGDPDDTIAGIIMLCGAERVWLSTAHGFPHVNGMAERLMKTAALAHQFPDIPVVLTGGSYSDTVPAQAEVAARFLRSVGISEERILIEDQSGSTSDSAVFVYRMVQPDDREWALVTSAFHMPRAMGAFRQAGWSNLTAVPTDYRAYKATASFFSHRTNFNHVYLSGHEWLGLAYYRLTGRIATVFPGPSTMTD